MIKPFVDAGFSVSFYPVYFASGRLVQEYSAAEPCDVLLIMDYFGYAGGQPDVPGDTICIRDLTHSVLTGKYTDADYYFGSLRKWAGFWTGGFAVGCEPCGVPVNEGYISLREQAMNEKRRYLCGETDSKGYLAVFAQAEDWLETGAVCGGALRDVRLAMQLDVEHMKTVRRENAGQLLDVFADMALFPEIGEQDCPLFVPVLVPEGRRDELRCHLIERQIYCPVHWPVTSFHRPDERSMQIYRNELSLVCDQRYTPEDMDRMIRAIKEFFER